LSKTYKTAKINFITLRAADIIRTAYYIHGFWCDKINFTVLYVSLNERPYTRCYKTAVFLL